MVARKRSAPASQLPPTPSQVVDPVLDSQVDDLEDLSDSVHISCGKHRVEQEVQKELLAHPALSFSSLVVRRTQGGVCLEGVLEVDEGGPDVCRLAKAVSGVDEVLNHLVIQRRDLPAKG